MSKIHAVLSPSAAERWLTCTPSARLEQSFQETSSSYADEGTLAHELGEYIIRWKLDRINKARFDVLLAGIKKNQHYTEAMYEYCDDYATYVIEQYMKMKAITPDAQLMLEKMIGLGNYIPEGFGTGDAVIVSDGWLKLIDLKYGKGVPVSCIENKQMMTYGLGLLDEFDFVYDLDDISLTVFQPRLDNISTWEISADKLKAWGRDVLIPTAQKAFQGEGTLVPGKHCQFCKVKPQCKALAEYNNELAAMEFKNPNLLDDDDISFVLSRAAMFTDWLNAVKEYAMEQAVRHQKKWPGYKLVQGRSNRIYTDEDKVVNRLVKAGYDLKMILKPKAPKSITEMQRELGAKKFDELLKGLIIKPPGKPVLVLDSDTRPALDSAAAAALDFKPEK
jgi:hypothetical protein